MPTYEREVISIPAGDSYELLLRHSIHAHPDTKGFSYKTAKYYTFRKRGGEMEFIFQAESIFLLSPYNNGLDSIDNLEVRQRIKSYIDDRFHNYEFDDEDAQYKFYLLNEVYELPHKPKLHRRRNQSYFRLNDLLSGIDFPEPDNSDISYEFDEEGWDNYETTEIYMEGATQKVYVNKYERNENARQACLNHYGYACSACGFDFEREFGSIGVGIIHVHHLRPLSEIGEEYQIDPIADLRPICPNCHLIIHLRQPCHTIEEVKNMIVLKVRPNEN